MPANLASYRDSTLPLIVQGPQGWCGMIAPPPRIWPAPPPAHVNGTSAATRYGYSSLAQILPSPQDKGDEQPNHQQPQQQAFAEEPVKLRKEPKHSTSTEWRRSKDRSRVKIEPAITPCQVQEVTTSSKHEQNSAGGIPVGIAVARQRVQQQSTPPPLTVLTCEERSTNQVTGWTGPPPHWHYPGVDQSLPLQVPPLQLQRDPISGQLLIFPSGNLGESMQRAVLWPSGNTSSNSAPPPLVMPGHQPVLVDRFVTLAPPPSSASSGHHHQEKRRSHDHSTTTIHGGNSGGFAVGLFPPPPPPQAPFLMMPFSHQNNSLLLSTQLTEHNLNTMVVTNHQLSESAVLNPMEVITSPVDGFGGGSMIQQLPPSVVISHTETNSFVRSDINAVYPAPQAAHVHPQPHHAPNDHHEVIVKEEVELNEDLPEEEPIEEETKAEVMDASNQTESPVEESEEELVEEVAVKVENKECSTDDAPPQEPDISGLELLFNSIAQYEQRNVIIDEPCKPAEPEFKPKPEMKEERRDDWKEETSISSGLGLLCTVAQRCLEEEVVEDTTSNCAEIPEAEETREESPEKVLDTENIKMEQVSEESQQSTGEKDIITGTPEKQEEWYTPEEQERDREVLKVKIKRRPGRPRKKSKTRKISSPSRCEPPVLQPWSASPDGDKSPLGSPPTLTPHKRKLSQDMSQESDEGSSSSSGHPPPLSPACSSSSSSKKRKVGRPKKRDEVSPEKTETIVTKTLPCNKAIVDLLMANKHQDHQQSTGSHKIKPKLKAEAKVKDWCDDEELDLSPGKENELDDPLLSPPPVWQSPSKPKAVSLSPPRKPKVKIVEQVKKEEIPIPKSPLRGIVRLPKSPHSSGKSPLQTTPGHRTPTAHRVSTPHRTPVPQRTSTPQRPSTPQLIPSSPKSESLQHIPDCKLTEEQLKSLPCRILSISNGQFYPGEVTKIIAPDIYEVHIYKERCRKPQILCRDEVLSSSVAEMHCPEEMFIPSGTRVCAYWSQQYSCFYPGRVVSDSYSGQVPIDFDDGDNGTIERTSVRFLPQDYPIVEQPPNPLVGKRKRYNSTTSSDSHKNNDTIEHDNSNNSSEIEEKAQPHKIEVKPEVKDNKMSSVLPETVEKSSEDDRKSVDSEEMSSTEDKGANDAIMSVLEGFFRSEEEERERLKNGEKIRRKHKHHKHRECLKTHKCKHKHHRSHKHKHSRDESRKSEASSNSINEKDAVETNGISPPTEEKQRDPHKESSEEDVKKGDGSVTRANKSKSKIAAFLPEKHEMWSWVGQGVKRGRALGPRGKGLKIFYKTIKRGPEVINLGDCAVFVSTGRPDRPFIGQIESFWQCHMKKNMVVKVSWFYHPEETIGCPDNLPYPGGLFKSPHVDNNDVQTISHRCEVLPLAAFREKAEKIPGFLDTVYENNETYYLAGHYQPAGTTLTLEPGVMPPENEKTQAD